VLVYARQDPTVQSIIQLLDYIQTVSKAKHLAELTIKKHYV